MFFLQNRERENILFALCKLYYRNVNTIAIRAKIQREGEQQSGDTERGGLKERREKDNKKEREGEKGRFLNIVKDQYS